MENVKLLPLGSIVYLKEGTKKVIIVARAVVLKNGDGFIYFDYGGVPYPEGITDDQMAYFQHETITKVVFEGYQDLDDEAIRARIDDFVAKHPEIPRGNVKQLLGEE